MIKTILLISFVSASLIFGCKSQPQKQIQKGISKSTIPQESIDNFWKWFVTNENRLQDFQQNPDKILTEVLDSARKIQRGLAIEFEPPKNGIVNVTISADGDRNLFPVVKNIIDKAPHIKGWNFIAFRQRIEKEKAKNMALTIQGKEIKSDELKFFPVISGDTLDVIVYGNNITDENYNQAAYSLLTLIDNILGEYDCVTKVRHYDFQNMPTSKKELEGLQPLLNLAEYVDDFQKSKH